MLLVDRCIHTETYICIYTQMVACCMSLQYSMLSQIAVVSSGSFLCIRLEVGGELSSRDALRSRRRHGIFFEQLAWSAWRPTARGCVLRCSVVAPRQDLGGSQRSEQSMIPAGKGAPVKLCTVPPKSGTIRNPCLLTCALLALSRVQVTSVSWRKRLCLVLRPSSTVHCQRGRGCWPAYDFSTTVFEDLKVSVNGFRKAYAHTKD
jgi:hypothetical protein